MSAFIFFAALLLVGIFIVIYPFITIIGERVESYFDQAKPSNERDEKIIDVRTEEDRRN